MSDQFFVLCLRVFIYLLTREVWGLGVQEVGDHNINIDPTNPCTGMKMDATNFGGIRVDS